MKFRYLIIVVLTVLTACTKVPVYNISGVWEGGDGEYVYILRTIEEKHLQTLDSALVENGQFRMSKPLDIVDEATFKAGKISIPFILEEYPIIITCLTIEKELKGEKISQLQVSIKGSPEQDIYKEFVNAQKNEMLFMIGLAFMNKSEDSSQSLIDSVANLYLQTKEHNQLMYDSLVMNNPDKVVSAVIIKEQYKKWGLEKAERMYDGLMPHVKESAPGLSIKEAIAMMKSVSLGAPAPDFELTAPDDTPVKLSDYRGKYVLLDFWASWCGPCLKEIPNVKKVYEAYHDRGFEILGISLDENDQAWEKAIAAHALNWHHASSLKGWACPVAKKYNVSGIPAMFLIDPSGNIIDDKLRGGALEEKISRIFND